MYWLKNGLIQGTVLCIVALCLRSYRFESCGAPRTKLVILWTNSARGTVFQTLPNERHMQSKITKNTIIQVDKISNYFYFLKQTYSFNFIEQTIKLSVLLTWVSACISLSSWGLSLVRSKSARSLVPPPKSHFLGFFPSFAGFGLLL